MWPFNPSNTTEPGWFDSNHNAGMATSNIYEVPRADNAPTEPVTLVQAKAACRVDFTDDDTLITSLITQCRKMVEEYCNLSLVTKTATALIDLITPIEIPYGPNASAIVLTDRDGNVIDAANYRIDGIQFPRIDPQGFYYYKAKLSYSCGYAAGTVDPDLCLAILNELAFRYENRGDAADSRKAVNPGICEAARIIAEPYKRFSWV